MKENVTITIQKDIHLLNENSMNNHWKILKKICM